MKTLKIFTCFLFLFLCQAVLYPQNVSPQFSELKGIEDQLNNTNLLYRIYSSYSDSNINSANRSIYNFNPVTLTDTIFLLDGFSCSGGIFPGYGKTVNSYDFWNNDLTKYIYCGEETNCIEGSGYISRYDSQQVRGSLFESYNNIHISKQNDGIVYAAYPILKSTDGGFNWITINDAMSFLSLSPFDDNVHFATGSAYWWGGSFIYKTTDGGNNYFIVDTSGYYSSEFYYDADENHIYRTNTTGYQNHSLKVSDNYGNAFSWRTIFTSDKVFYVCLDESNSGTVYLADGKKILVSTDYGSNFSVLKEFDKNLVGIYKKPNSDKLYAATKYRLYEITSDTIYVIKTLPVPAELFELYPLSVGNKWIYNYQWIDWISYHSPDIFSREVISEVVKPNGKMYYEIIENMGMEDTVYERIDTLEGKIYRYEEYCPGSEQLIEDLVMDVGDSSFASRFDYCNEYGRTELTSEQSFSKWDLDGVKHNYFYVTLVTAEYSLASKIGLEYFKLSDDNGEKTYSLKGMVINDIVYGDTTITSLRNDISSTPDKFELSYNFPNPFNPKTRIKYSIKEAGLVKIKVYDVLGSEIKILVDEVKEAGFHSVEFDGSNLPSGVYIYSLKVNGYNASKKMILLK